MLDELGSGLGHFAVALVNLSGADAPTWVLVDEPENGLHPTLQLEFVSLPERLATEGVVLATHSYGLARRVADHVYVVEQDQPKHRSVVRDHREMASLAEFLGELGFSGYRDLGVDRIVLVEGPTDAHVVDEIRRTLGLHGNAVLLPMGGSDLINRDAEAGLREITRLSEQVYAVIDSERSSANEPLSRERQAFVDACGRVGVECHVLARRATENYFPDRAVKRVLGSDAMALEAYTPLGRRWNKRENRRIAREMSRSEIADTDLGQILQRVFRSDP